MKNIIRIFSITREFWKWYFFMGLFIITVALLTLATPILMKQIVDVITGEISTGRTAFQPVILYLVLIIVSDVSVTVLTSYSTWIGDVLAVKLQTYLTRMFYQHLLSLDIGFFDNEITGRIVNKMYRGIESISDFVKSMINNFLPFFLSAFLTIILLAFYSPVIALLLACLFPAYIWISHSSTLAWGKYEEKKNRIHDLSQGRVFESLAGMRAVKAFVAEIVELAAYSKARVQIEDLTREQTRQWHLLDFYRRLVLNGILFAILAYIVINTFRGRYTLGEMTLLIQLTNQARFPLFAMSFILGQIQAASAGSRDFFSILSRQSAITEDPQAKVLTIAQNLKKSTPLVVGTNLEFSYETKKRVLSDVSFTVGFGEKLALVGESGQGKSTLVNLILRFYEPQSGRIMIAGKDLTKIKLASLRKNIAVVFQESLLFSGTVRENILYGKPGATDQEIRLAAKGANADEFIKVLPDGYDTLIGERGLKLSGGQKQRIAIARAILTDAPIIILDEATSSLDSRSELLVQEGLNRLMKGRTTIIIAHRLSTVADSDHVLVLSGGQVAQYGTPKELLNNSKGLYARMVALQKTLMTASPEEREAALKQYDLVG
jgi:ATP-binding cassette subfamily B protein